MSALREGAKSGKLEVLDLLSGSKWENGTAEGRLQVSEAARREGPTGLRWIVDRMCNSPKPDPRPPTPDPRPQRE